MVPGAQAYPWATSLSLGHKPIPGPQTYPWVTILSLGHKTIWKGLTYIARPMHVG